MSEERTKDLPMRLRRSRGLALSSSWLEKLSQASDLQIKEDDLLSLEETERLRNMFLERLRATPEQQWFWSGEERSHVIAALRSIPVQSHTKVILFSDVDIYIGAVTIDGKVVLEHPFKIWDVVGNDLMLSSPSIGDGLCLEFNIYGRNKTEYELSLWGRFSLPEANVAGASRVSMYQ